MDEVRLCETKIVKLVRRTTKLMTYREDQPSLWIVLWMSSTNFKGNQAIKKLFENVTCFDCSFDSVTSKFSLLISYLARLNVHGWSKSIHSPNVDICGIHTTPPGPSAHS